MTHRSQLASTPFSLHPDHLLKHSWKYSPWHFWLQQQHPLHNNAVESCYQPHGAEIHHHSQQTPRAPAEADDRLEIAPQAQSKQLRLHQGEQLLLQLWALQLWSGSWHSPCHPMIQEPKGQVACIPRMGKKTDSGVASSWAHYNLEVSKWVMWKT